MDFVQHTETQEIGKIGLIVRNAEKKPMRGTGNIRIN